MMAGNLIIGGIVDLADSIYKRVKLVKVNQAQCQRLVERIRIVDVAIRKLDQAKQSQNFKPALESLEKCLEESLEFIDQFTQQKKWYQKAINAGENQSHFQRLNEQLKACVALLNLGAAAQQINNREQDLADQKADAVALKAGQAEILSLNQRMMRELQEFKGAAEQRDGILARQMASLKYQLQAALHPGEAKLLIALRDHIPYFELVFHEVIGRGSICTVYRGSWNDQVVAIKLLSMPLAKAEGQEFSREVAIISRLKNQHIVQFYGACLEEGYACLVMEWMSKGTLYEHLGKNALNSFQRKQIALDIAKGLHYLHHNGYIHRDLRSENILLNADYRAKIADFGLVKTRAQSIQSIAKISQAVSWCAPEILSAQPEITFKADIFSFGMILWELFTDKKPFEGVSLSALTQKIIAGQRETLSDEIPAEFHPLITACWSEKPGERPNLPELIKQLDRYNPADSYYKKGKKFEEAKRFAEAKQHYQIAADAGLSNALTSLGIFSLRGLGGVPQDKEKAFQLFVSAAEKGHSRAMKNAAVMLDRGDGIVQDQKQALFWYQKAGDAGDGEALERAIRLKEKLSVPVTTAQP